MSKVTVIQPVVQRLIVDSNTFQPKKLRVAAYARVSTEQDEQQNSYEAQVSYYTHFIEANTEWEFAGIFAEEEPSYPALFLCVYMSTITKMTVHF